jgi:hypothetical protein
MLGEVLLQWTRKVTTTIFDTTTRCKRCHH